MECQYFGRNKQIKTPRYSLFGGCGLEPAVEGVAKAVLRVNGLEVVATGYLLVAIFAGHKGAFAANVSFKGPLPDGFRIQQVLRNRLSQHLGVPDAIKVQGGQQAQERGVHLSLGLVVVAYRVKSIHKMICNIININNQNFKHGHLFHVFLSTTVLIVIVYLRQGIVNPFIGLFVVKRRLRTDDGGGKDHVLVVKIGVQARNGRIGLELLPEAHDDDQCGDRSDRCETEPHELLADGPARFGNVAHSVERRVLEELLRLVDEAAPKDDQRLEAALPSGLRRMAFLLRHFRFRNIARPRGSESNSKSMPWHPVQSQHPD